MLVGFTPPPMRAAAYRPEPRRGRETPRIRRRSEDMSRDSPRGEAEASDPILGRRDAGIRSLVILAAPWALPAPRRAANVRNTVIRLCLRQPRQSWVQSLCHRLNRSGFHPRLPLGGYQYPKHLPPYDRDDWKAVVGETIGAATGYKKPKPVARYIHSEGFSLTHGTIRQIGIRVLDASRPSRSSRR